MHKKAIGETMTWVVATIIIVVILAITIIAASLMKNRGIFIMDSGERANVFVTKSLAAYLLSENNGERVYEQLKTEEDLNEFNGNLALKIFKGLYEEDYGLDIWMGVEKGNSFFDTRPIGKIQKSPMPVAHNTQPFVSEIIKLNEKNLELILIEDEK